MKIRHRVTYEKRPDPEWSERVEREAEATTNRAQVNHEKRESRLQRAKVRHAQAERRSVAAESRKVGRKERRRLDEQLERRRQELLAIQAEMQSSPYGSQHRGRDSFRPVPRSSTL